MSKAIQRLHPCPTCGAPTRSLKFDSDTSKFRRCENGHEWRILRGNEDGPWGPWVVRSKEKLIDLSQGPRKDPRSELHRSRLVKAMRDEKRLFTLRGSCEHLFLSVDNQNYRYLRALHKEGLVYICSWVKGANHRFVAEFGWKTHGLQKDAIKPVVVKDPLADAIRSRKRRARLIEEFGIEAVRSIDRMYYHGGSMVCVDGKVVWRRQRTIQRSSKRGAQSGSDVRIAA